MNTNPSTASTDRIAYLCEKGGSRDPRLAAIRLAEGISSKCTTQVPPVDVEELCRLRKVTPLKTHLTGSAARLIPVGDHYVAEVNVRHPATRQRFSICHEIGHTLFEERPVSDGGESPCANNLYRQKLEERLCDTVAAELLMPRVVFSQFLRNCQPSIYAVRRAGAAFQVSTYAVARRVIELNLWPSALLLLRGDERNKMRMCGYWPSESMQIRVAPAIAIKEIISRDWLSGRLVVPVRSGSLSVEYYTYRVPSQFYVCSMLFATGMSSH
jgi:hypothetical protein